MASEEKSSGAFMKNGLWLFLLPSDGRLVEDHDTPKLFLSTSISMKGLKPGKQIKKAKKKRYEEKKKTVPPRRRTRITQVW